MQLAHWTVRRARPVSDPSRALAIRTVIAAISASVLFGACSGGGTVDELTIVNGTVYDLELRATDEDRSGWVPLGRVLREARATRELVSDLGDVWVFRFEYAGRELGGELRVGRAELERRDWRVDVPDDVERRLRRAGIDPSPRGG